LQDTAHEDLAALVNKMRREERYHLIHAEQWIKRVAHGPAEGRSKLVAAVGEVFDEAMGLFEPFELEEAAVKEGWLPVPSSELQQRFLTRMSGLLDQMGFPTHEPSRTDAEFVASSSGDLIASDGGGDTPQPHDASGGRSGRRSSDFDGLWEDMTTTYRTHPGARW
jgi:ring-1,2-phenylacetyl-CoA epoxidase subunit PaaC